MVAVLIKARGFAEERRKALGTSPVLTPEDFLLATALNTELDLSARLIRSGLDVGRLEEAVKTLRPQLGYAAA